MDTSLNNTTKQFVLIPKKLPTEKKIKPKEKTKRMIANTKIHEFTTERLENQHTLLFETRDISNQSFVSKEIRKKYMDINTKILKKVFIPKRILLKKRKSSIYYNLQR
jgi:hypothetical protein